VHLVGFIIRKSKCTSRIRPIVTEQAQIQVVNKEESLFHSFCRQGELSITSRE
jgi:hypothetical protein